MAKEVNEQNFEEEVLKSEIPVVVDLWAEWCGPCVALTPILEEVAKDYENKVKVVKVNVDNNPGIAQQYGVASIPTLLYMKEGKVVAQNVGLRPKSELAKSFEDLVNS